MEAISKWSIIINLIPESGRVGARSLHEIDGHESGRALLKAGYLMGRQLTWRSCLSHLGATRGMALFSYLGRWVPCRVGPPELFMEASRS